MPLPFGNVTLKAGLHLFIRREEGFQTLNFRVVDLTEELELKTGGIGKNNPTWNNLTNLRRLLGNQAHRLRDIVAVTLGAVRTYLKCIYHICYRCACRDAVEPVSLIRVA